MEADLQQAYALYRREINSYQMEKRYIRKDGTTVWVKLTGSVVFDELGEFKTFVAVIEDISEKKKSEVELLEKKEQLSNILNSITDYYIAVDRDYRLIEINFNAEHEVFQQPAEKIKGKVLWELYPKGKGDIFHKEYEKAFNENVPVHFEAKSNVTDKWLEVHAYPRNNSLEIFFRDISERKKLEEKLRWSENKFSKLFFNSPGFMFIKDIDNGEFVEVNDSFCRLTGFKREDFYGKSLADMGILTKENRNELLEQVTQQGGIKSQELQLTDKNGEKRTVLFSAVCISIDDKNCILSSGIDISEKKKYSEALVENEKRLQLVLNNSHDGIHMVDLSSNRYVFMSPSQERLTGFTREELNFSMEEAANRLHPDDVSGINTYLSEIMSGRQPVNPMEYRWRVKSGEYRWFSDSRKLVQNAQGENIAMVGISRDITALKETEQALRESETNFRLLANNISQLAWMMDSEGWVYWFNQRWYDYTGTSFEDMQGWGWQKVHHPEHIDRVLLSKKKSIEKGQVWEDLFPLRSKEGEYKWFLTRAIPLKNDDGTIIRWLGTNTDITRQRDVENRLKNDSKLFEDLLYIAAHDLKGPIANLHGALDMMESLPAEKKLLFLNRFRELADQLDTTVQGVSDILRMRNDEKSAASIINLNDLLNDILKEINIDFSSVTCSFEKHNIKYLKVYLYSILKNLISNSVKYCREDVPVSIHISSHIQNDYTVLSVRDNGIGIDLKNYADKLFTPFQRVKSKKAKGTGIGLYLVKDIIEKNGGKITVESTPGEGTTFYCFLKEY